MNANFYHFNKRKNSTLLPAGSPQIAEIRLKDSTSILSPAIEVQTLSQPYTHNYIYIPEYDRYYFVSNWTYERGIWIAQTVEDYLASWRNSIRGTTAFVELSSSNYSSYAIDSRVANLTSYSRRQAQFLMRGILSGDIHNDASGSFIIDVINDNKLHKSGMSQKYILNRAQMNAFAGAFQEPGIWEQLKQFYTNPLDSIIDCYYLPIDIGLYVGVANASEVKLGEYTVPGVSGFTTLNTSLACRSFTMTFPIQFAYSDFRRATACTCELFVPFCGTCALPVAHMMYTNTLYVDYSIDPNTGGVQAIAYNQDNSGDDRDEYHILATASGNMKVQLPVGQVQTRIGGYLGAIQGVAGSAASALISKDPNTYLGGISAFQSLAAQAEIKNMGAFDGSILGACIGDGQWQEARLHTTCYNTLTEPSDLTAVQGRPCGKTLQLSSLSGYCQTSGASVSMAGMDSERDEVNRLLDSGIYLE